jgi:hypothetical protein
MGADNPVSFLRTIRGSLVGVLLLLLFDGVMFGSFTFSALVCPFWFFASLVKSLSRLPGWKIAIVRATIPVVTLMLLFSNARLQSSIASANARQVIAAIEQFHGANGRYPDKLNDLVPRYLASVPPAKYCIGLCEFKYWVLDGKASLMKVVVPPFGHDVYSLEKREWKYLD